MARALPLIVLVAVSTFLAGRASAEVSREAAMRAAIHPVTDDAGLQSCRRAALCPRCR